MKTRIRKVRDIFIPIRGVSGNKLSNKKKFITSFLEFKRQELKSNKSYNANVSLNVKFFFSNVSPSDIDNLLKSLFDALQEVKILRDDKQIKQVKAEIKEYSLFEGISLVIKQIK